MRQVLGTVSGQDELGRCNPIKLGSINHKGIEAKLGLNYIHPHRKYMVRGGVTDAGQLNDKQLLKIELLNQ